VSLSDGSQGKTILCKASADRKQNKDIEQLAAAPIPPARKQRAL